MKTFSKNDTNIAKGIGCLLLLFHHLFYSSKSWERFYSIGGFNPPLVSYLAIHAKVCVAIFVVLSGYGLAKSALSSEKLGGGCHISRILNLYLQYWYIFIIFVSLGFILERNPWNIYGISDSLHTVAYFIGDFFGISSLLKWPTMNATWWFMGAIIPLYMLFPLLFKATKKMPAIVLLMTFAVGFINSYYNHAILIWLFPFVCGIFVADRGLFDKFMGLPKKIQYPVLIASTSVFAALRTEYGILVDGFLATAIILFSVLLLGQAKYINTAVAFIGKHSGNIFMFHTFIYSYYFKDFIYSFRFPIIILFVLLGVCILISVMIEMSKDLTRFSHFQKHINNKLKG